MTYTNPEMLNKRLLLTREMIAREVLRILGPGTVGVEFVFRDDNAMECIFYGACPLTLVMDCKDLYLSPDDFAEKWLENIGDVFKVGEPTEKTKEKIISGMKTDEWAISLLEDRPMVKTKTSPRL
jgi:hypothetical protein